MDIFCMYVYKYSQFIYLFRCVFIYTCTYIYVYVYIPKVLFLI